MTLKQHLFKNLTLAYPVMIGQLGHIMVGVADTAMVGRVGVVPLAGATFAGTIYHLCMLFGIGLSYGLTPLVAAVNPGNKSIILRYLQNSLLLNIVVGLLLFLLVLSLIPFLNFFGQEPEVVEAAKPYLVIVSFSVIPLMIFQTFRQFSEGQSNTFNPMLVSLFANLINVALNYLLIFGKLGFPEMGLVGAGYATLISRVVMFILMMVLSYKMWQGLKFEVTWSQIKILVKIGVPSGLQYVFEIGAFAMSAIMVGWIGAEALAAHQIAMNMAAVTYMAATGIAAASTIRMGNQMGQKDLKNLRIAGYSSLGMVAVFMGFCGICFILFRYPLAALYIEDPGVQKMAAGLLIIAAAFQISDGLQAVGLGILRGLTDVKVPTIVTFFAYWLLAIPGAYILGFVFDLGVKGVWYALSGGLTVAAILHFIRFRNKLGKIRF